MYLILLPDKKNQGEYQAFFNSDIDMVYIAIEEKVGAMVYKLDALPKIKELKRIHEEVIEEKENG